MLTLALKYFYAASSFSAILAILLGFAVKFLGPIIIQITTDDAQKYLELKEKTKTKPSDRRKTIEEDINKPRRNIDGQETRDGED